MPEVIVMNDQGMGTLPTAAPKGDKPLPELFGNFDSDLANDNLMNDFDLTQADLMDSE